MKSARKHRLRTLLPAAVISTAALMCAIESCTDIGCTDLRSSIPMAGFYSSTSDQQVTLDSLLIGGVGAPNDSLLVDTANTTSKLYLPFRSEQSSTAYFIKYVNKALDHPWLVDTITFNYESTPYFASADCGAMYVYNITSMSYTTHLIDSVALTDPLINNVDIERIKIYFRTSEEPQE